VSARKQLPVPLGDDVDGTVGHLDGGLIVKAFDIEFGQTSRWDGDRLVVISAFWDSALQARQLGLA
jgi:hypothetical protein